MSSESQQPAPSPDLPPVEAPTAGFIVQLFVIPALIVLIVIAVFTGIKQLVPDQDPKVYLQAIKRDNEGRWQAAHDLADLLRTAGNERYKRDRGLALELAAILDSQILERGMDEYSLKLRIYLCHALGEFQVEEGLDVLMLAAATERTPDERVVRFSALKALAVLLNGMPEPQRKQACAKARKVILRGSRDSEPIIRSTAAFGLGADGSPEAIARLEAMLNDQHADVRYNAATMLARRGNLSSERVLVEMLDPDQEAALKLESDKDARALKRDLILVNALRAADELFQSNPKAKLASLKGAVKRLANANVLAPVRLKADELHIKMTNPNKNTRS